MCVCVCVYIYIYIYIYIYNVGAILFLQYVEHIRSFPMLNVLTFS